MNIFWVNNLDPVGSTDFSPQGQDAVTWHKLKPEWTQAYIRFHVFFNFGRLGVSEPKLFP